MLNKPVPCPSEFFTEEKNTIMRREKEDAIYEQPQVCPSLPRQSDSFGPSKVRGDTRYSNQYKRMKIYHRGGRGEGVVSECYIQEQTQAFLTDQTVVNTTTRRGYFRTIDTAAGLYVADTVPNGMGEE